MDKTLKKILKEGKVYIYENKEGNLSLNFVTSFGYHCKPIELDLDLTSPFVEELWRCSMYHDSIDKNNRNKESTDIDEYNYYSEWR